jgi:hypothetical protein
VFYVERYQTHKTTGEESRYNIPIRITANGKLYATGGDIAGWEISSSQIGNVKVGMYSGSSYKYDSLILNNPPSSVRFYAGGTSTT